ncbi:MAG: hypothetical protein KGL66_10455 [Alphaproteobacteria bacterium]|nr:hypothetical protein [Alphaproteobacteria bacterium]
MKIKHKTILIAAAASTLIAFLGWRMVRPLEIFSVSPRFEYPLATANIPTVFPNLRAETCGACHTAVHRDWKTSMHAQAWSDPYFQADYKNEGNKQICLNCHTPLDRQQKFRVIGFHVGDKWNPVLAPNPQFDPVAKREGVTCAACHLRHGVIYGPYGVGLKAPHPTARWNNSNEVCVRCHVVNNRRWDVFYRLPPCGTVAEIASARRRFALRHQNIETTFRISPSPAAPATLADDGYGAGIPAGKVAALNCVECHMPAVERPLVPGGAPRAGRQHLWRGGHDPRTVTAVLRATFEAGAPAPGQQRYVLTLTNTGAEHDVPTGVPDRHLNVDLRLLDAAGRVLRSETYTIERTVLWRPFIVDLWDTRLKPGEPRRYSIAFSSNAIRPASVEAVVRYEFMDASHRARLHYRGAASYVVFQRQILLHQPAETPHSGL